VLLIGYARVSKSNGLQTVAPQRCAAQRNALLVAGVDPDRIYEDLASGRNDARPGLIACLKALQPGKTLVLWKLDRLGRDLRHLVHFTRSMAESVRLLPCQVQSPALLFHRFASRSNVLIALFDVQAFGQSSSRALRFVPNLLCLRLTSARASRHLSMPVAQGTHADLPGYCAPTFTLMPVGYTS
jgi:hypothetical protein